MPPPLILAPPPASPVGIERGGLWAAAILFAVLSICRRPPMALARHRYHRFEGET